MTFTIKVDGRTWQVDDARLYDAIAAAIEGLQARADGHHGWGFAGFGLECRDVVDFIWQVIHTVSLDDARPVCTWPHCPADQPDDLAEPAATIDPR